MAERYLICPLCGFEFAPADTVCSHLCPLRSRCGLTCCPSCDYEFPERPVAWLSRLLHRGAARPPAACVRPITVRELRAGERARVAVLGGPGGRSNTLAAFGLVPGCEIQLVQSRPEYVLRVGETDLALDAGIAAEIVVERLPTPAG